MKDDFREGFYEDLGVDPGATQDDIKRAYRNLASRVHPDQNRSSRAAAEAMKAINRAHENLRNPETRRRYDEWLRQKPERERQERQAREQEQQARERQAREQQEREQRERGARQGGSPFAAENTAAAPPKPLIPSWLAVPLTVIVVGGLLLLAVRGLHAMALAGWLGNGDIYLLIVFGAAGLLFLLIAIAGRGGDVISALEKSRQRKVQTNRPRRPVDGDKGDFDE